MSVNTDFLIETKTKYFRSFCFHTSLISMQTMKAFPAMRTHLLITQWDPTCVHVILGNPNPYSKTLSEDVYI